MTRYDLGPEGAAPKNSRVALILGIQTPLLVLALFLYAVRIYTRCRPVVKLWWDDYLISLAMLCSLVSYGITIRIIELGYGQHIQYVDLSNIVAYARLNFIMQPLWVWGVTFIKLSVACLLIRLKRNTVWKVAMAASMFYLVASAIAVTVLQLTECRPLHFYWDRTAKGGSCRDPHVVQMSVIGTSVVFVISDLFFSLTPLFFIFTLSFPMREKLFLVFLMGLGVLASIIGGLKFIGISKLFATTDPTWDSVPVKLGSFVESSLGIMAACIPCLRAMGEKTLRRLGLTITSRTESGSTSRSWTHKGSCKEDTVHDSEDSIFPTNHEPTKGRELAIEELRGS